MRMASYAPRPLSTARAYPGYQFRARLSLEGRTAGECLRYAALVVQNWLCERIRKAEGAVPEEVLCPPASACMEIGDDALRSCALPFAEIVSIPAQGVWALMVREPDPALAGRSYVTHVGLRAGEGREVEFGVNIEIVDRDPALQEAERAYRPQFVRLLFETEGMTLLQAGPLAFRRYVDVRDRRGVKALRAILDDPEGQLPIVVFTHAPRIVDPAQLGAKMFGELPLGVPDTLLRFMEPSAVAAGPEYCLPYDAEEFARHIYGYAQACVAAPEAFGALRAQFERARLQEGDILILEPKRFGGAVRKLAYRAGLDAAWYRSITDELQQELESYSKHKPFSFGGVLFEDGAKQVVRDIEFEAMRDSVHLEKGSELAQVFEQLERERADNAALTQQNAELRARMQEEYLRGAETGAEKLAALQQKLEGVKAENVQLRSANESMRRAFEENDAMRRALQDVRQIARRPRTNADVAAFFQKVFADRIDFTERGLRTAARCDVNPDVLWEGLYHAATLLVELHRASVRDVDIQFRNKTGWELALSEGAQTRSDPGLMALRRDVYQGRDISVEPHIKFPRSSLKTGAKYQRLYYAYDPHTGRVVVGCVGDHLENFLSLGFH